MAKNIHNFEIFKTVTRDWYLASEVDEKMNELQELSEELQKKIEEVEYQLQQSTWNGLSKEEKDASIRMNSQ